MPANADFVIEGYVDPREPLREEGPFGDHTGFYTLPEPYPVFHITAITHRQDAVYPATIVGLPPMEDFYIGGASVKLFLPIFRMNFPEIVDIALPAEGVFHNLVFVSIRKTYPMQAYKIMHGLWGMGQMMFTKYIVVVDDDVDVHNTSEVLFRLCANTDPQRDSHLHQGPGRRPGPRHQRNGHRQQARVRRDAEACRRRLSNAPGRRSSKWMKPSKQKWKECSTDRPAAGWTNSRRNARNSRIWIKAPFTANHGLFFPSETPMTHQDHYDDAMFDYSMGELDVAMDKLKQILQEDPRHFDAQLALAMCYSRKGDFTTAIAEGHKAESLNPKEPLVHTNLSLFYVKAGDKQKAEHHGALARMASWKDAIARSSTTPPVRPSDATREPLEPQNTGSIDDASQDLKTNG